MASSSLSSADHTPKSRKVAMEYSTDETDEDKIPDMDGGHGIPLEGENGQVDHHRKFQTKAWLQPLNTAMLPYYDEGDLDNEPIELEGGQKMVIRRCIISPDEATMPEEDPDKLEDLGA